MLYFYATLLLTVEVVVLAILYWRSIFRTTTAPTTTTAAINTTTATTTPKPQLYLIAYAIIFVLAMLVPTPVSVGYKAAILFGLMLALIGTAAHTFLKAPPVVVHAIDLLVALVYIVTFLAHHPLKWPTPWLLLPLLLLGGLYLFLRPHLAELHSTLLAYGVILWLLLWQALEVLTVAPTVWAGLAVAGVAGFVLTKATIATHFLLQQSAVPQSIGANSTGANSTGTKNTGTRSASNHTQSRWNKLLTSSEQVAQRWGHRLQLATGARVLSLATPFLILLYQWLLVISIWGPSLTERIGQLP